MALVALPLTSAVLARPQVAPAPAAPPAQRPGPTAATTTAPTTAPTTAAPLLADGAIRVEAPVTAATVYSERARVARSARLTLSSPQSRLRFPPLCGQVDPASLRVDVQGYGAGGRGTAVEVARIEIERPLIGDLAQSTAQLPIAEVDRLVRAIEAIDDEHARLEEERGALRVHLDLLSRLGPAVPPIPSTSSHGSPLNPAGWADGLAFVRARQATLADRALSIDDRSHELTRSRTKLVEEVRKLSGGPVLPSPRRCYQVTATLSGQGLVDVWLTYMTSGARWQPTYDVVLLPDRGQVDLSFAGQVSQDSGEDWSDVQLTLSTAIPTQATQLPKLLSWKLGGRDRFIPTPAAIAAQASPPPPTIPPLSQPSAEAALRRRLLQLLGSSPPSGRVALGPPMTGGAPGMAAFGDGGGDRDHDGVPDAEDAVAAPEEAPPMDYKEARKDEAERMPAPPPPPPPPAPSPVLAEAKPRPYRQAAASRTTATTRSFESVTSTAPGSYSYDLGGETVEGSLLRPQAQVLGVGLMPPPGYQVPPLPSNSAAAQAGGYDLRYVSLYRESLGSGKGARRVALFSRRFPVSVLRKVFPALAPDAYLVAVMSNPLGGSGQPLPGGRARLFVGADPAGQADLQLVAPGERFTLPLGIDRAVKPIRNVTMTTEEKGVFSKDEITQYVVKIELVNPYPTPLDVLLVDQLPLPGDKNVELKLLSVSPPPSPPSTPPPPGAAPSPFGPNIDSATGAMEWRLSIPPGGKVETGFTYSLRRPKGARLYQ